MARISVIGDRFIDDPGRHVILRGINLVYKGNRENGAMNYIPSWDETVFENFKEWGFNVVRLGIIWDAVEPRPKETFGTMLISLVKRLRGLLIIFGPMLLPLTEWVCRIIMPICGYT